MLAYPLEYLSALIFELWLAIRIFFTRGFDAIHACNPPDTIFLIGGLFKLLAGTRFVFDHHDINPELYEAKFGRRDLFWRLLAWLERMTFRTADIVIATNGSYRRIAMERGGVAATKIFVVRSGPDLSRMQAMPPKTELRRGRAHLVGYVGVIGQQEGIDLLLQAVRTIVRDLGRHDIHFGIVGGGPALTDMKLLSRHLGIADYVTFSGRVSDRELLEMLNTADVCVNPDRANAMNDKSTMNKIMEYMALGKPIVQFDLTEGRVSAGDASLYAHANDSADMAAKIVTLIDCPSLRARMGEAGRQRVVDALSWEHEAPKLLAAYEALFKSRGAYAVAKPRPAE